MKKIDLIGIVSGKAHLTKRASKEAVGTFIKEVEKQILEAPEYYFWTHKRWKHRR